MRDHIHENATTRPLGEAAGALTPIPAASPITPGRFLKAKPIAARFGVCPKTIHRWANAGFVHQYKVTARVVLFDEAEVEKFVAAARV